MVALRNACERVRAESPVEWCRLVSTGVRRDPFVPLPSRRHVEGLEAGSLESPRRHGGRRRPGSRGSRPRGRASRSRVNPRRSRSRWRSSRRPLPTPAARRRQRSDAGREPRPKARLSWIEDAAGVDRRFAESTRRRPLASRMAASRDTRARALAENSVEPVEPAAAKPAPDPRNRNPRGGGIRRTARAAAHAKPQAKRTRSTAYQRQTLFSKSRRSRHRGERGNRRGRRAADTAGRARRLAHAACVTMVASDTGRGARGRKVSGLAWPTRLTRRTWAAGAPVAWASAPSPSRGYRARSA